MKIKFFYWYNHLLSSLLWMLGFGMMGCAEQGNEYGAEPVEYGPAPVSENEFYIDENFKATLEYLQGAWAAEYVGWDNIQESNTTIRRKLTLNPDGTYTNLIGCKLPKVDKDGFYKFESEVGMYTYDYASAIITYTCRSDSILNLSDQSYTVYSKKHYYDHQDSTYTEKVLFTVEKNGKRGWITFDTYLGNPKDNQHKIVYWMNRFDGDRESQNAQE